MKNTSALRLHLLVTLISSISLTLSAGDFTFYSVGKGQYYDQAAGGLPVSKLPFPHLFYAQVMQQSNGPFPPIQTATVRSTSWPASQTRSLTGSATSGFPVTFGNRYQTPDQLDTDYPGGDYQFNIQTMHDGLQIVTVSLTNGPLPSAPTIQNLSEAQSVDPTNDFTLTWEPFSEATDADFILVLLQRSDPVAFHTAYVPGTVGALNGTNTSVTIPAGTLQSGRAYLGRLIFARTQGISTNVYPGAWGTGFSFSQTDFWLRTQGAGDSLPPSVVTTAPANGAANVPTNTPIAFKFSEPLSPNGGSVSASGVPGSGPNQFNSDQTVFSLGTSGLSRNSSPIIVLNPFYRPPGFRDLNGNPVASDTILTFTTGTNRLVPLPALLTNAHWTANNSFQVDLLGNTSYYTLQRSENYSNWVNVQTNIAFDGKTSFIDTNAAGTSSRIYRAIAR